MVGTPSPEASGGLSSMVDEHTSTTQYLGGYSPPVALKSANASCWVSPPLFRDVSRRLHSCKTMGFPNLLEPSFNSDHRQSPFRPTRTTTNTKPERRHLVKTPTTSRRYKTIPSNTAPRSTHIAEADPVARASLRGVQVDDRHRRWRGVGHIFRDRW